MKIPNIVANCIASVCLSMLFAIIYLEYAPPYWAWTGATILFATIVYLYCSLVDATREYGVPHAK